MEKNEKRDAHKELAALESAMEEKGCASSLGLVAFGGSIAYGLDSKDSDVDLRGFFLPSARDLLLMKDADTVEIKEGVDGVMYSVNKMVSLLVACNPNVIEVLGISPEHVLVTSSFYEELLANKSAFVTQKAAGTFGGYAISQLRRIKNSMSRDKADVDATGALRSMEAAISHFSDKYTAYADGALRVRLENEDAGAKSLLVDMNLHDVPVTQLRGMCGDLDSIAKNADNLAARNRKKETGKLSKHMSHLVRLLRMGSELLETGEVNTLRTGEDKELLVALKKGLWMHEDESGVRHVDNEFWELLDAEQKRFERAKKETSLPKEPDRSVADELVASFHAKVLADVL